MTQVHNLCMIADMQLRAVPRIITEGVTRQKILMF